MVWVFKTAFKYCYLQIGIFIFILLFNSMLQLALNYEYKFLINELVSCIGSGISKSLVLYLFVYLLFMLIAGLNDSIYDIGYNKFRIKAELIFRKIFMYRSYRSSHDSLMNADFLRRYEFVNDNIYRTVDYIKDIIALFSSTISTLIGIIVVFLFICRFCYYSWYTVL